MLSPVGVGGFAVGFGIAQVGEGWYFRHGGSNWGFQCNLMAHKVKGYGFVIMTNASRGGAVVGELGRRIQVAYEFDSMAQPVPRGYAPAVERTEVEVASEILQTYVGAYELSDELTITVTLENGALFAESETEFFLKVANVQLTFTKDDAGEVDAVVLHQGGRDQRGPKVR
jgi:hypothetical protein